ncbi:MAG: endolytic transglycosylase MltG [Armatimonadota bacterium]
MADEQLNNSNPNPEPPAPGRRDPMAAAPAAPAAPKRLRPWHWALGIGLVLLVTAGILGLQANRLLFHPITFSTPQAVIVPRSATLSKLAPRLEEKGIIPSAFALRVYAKLQHKDNKLKAGEYQVSGKMSPVQILDLMNSGRVTSFWVTIPEGKWASEIGAFLAPRWPEAARELPALAVQPERFRGEFTFLEGDTLEGYLFPDTYLMSKGAGAESIVKAMLKAFEERCWNAYQLHPPADGRTFYQVLILASLVEAEAKVPSERPIIAGVYMNRLKDGMKLQCDASVLYAHRRRLTRVLYRDLEIDSPYNTYRYPGLPAGPICNPGADSFKAALQPAEVPFIYYVAKSDGSGGHIFSRTAAEHNAARQKYLQTLR